MKFIKNELSNLFCLLLLVTGILVLASGFGRIKDQEEEEEEVPGVSDTITIHCQVSPDMWKRYSVSVGGVFSILSKLQVNNGTWRFTSVEGVKVYSSICHHER